MRKELKRMIQLRPSDTKKLIPIPIEVPQGVETLRIRFSWSPLEVDDPELRLRLVQEKVDSYGAACEADPNIPSAVLAVWRGYAQEAADALPLRNLLNFSLYDPMGRFRGRWDSPQYFGKWMELGKNTSRGFLAGGISSGEWTLELEVHALLSESVAAMLEVELIGSNLSRWFSGEMHSHTYHSDGEASLAEVLDAVRELGLDFIVLSDHNTTAAYAEIPKENHDSLVIPGLEWTTFYGHAVALGIREYVDWRAAREDTLEDKISEVHRQGGLVSIAHPFAVGDPFCSGCEWEFANVQLTSVDLLEIWSGSWQKMAIPNWRALTWWDELLNKGIRITGVAARDVHRLAQLLEPDTANTYVYAPICSEEEILAALKAGAVQMSSGPIADFSVRTADGKVYSIGQTVPADGKASAELVVEVTAFEGDGAELQIIYNGKAVERIRDYKGECKRFSVPEDARWVRVQLHRQTLDETPLLITNPIYFG